MERLCYYRLDRLAGRLVIDLCSAEVLGGDDGGCGCWRKNSMKNVIHTVQQ